MDDLTGYILGKDYFVGKRHASCRSQNMQVLIIFDICIELIAPTFMIKVSEVSGHFYYLSVRRATGGISALFIGSPDTNSDELAKARSHATQSDEKQMSTKVKKKPQKLKNQPYYSSDLVMTL